MLRPRLALPVLVSAALAALLVLSACGDDPDASPAGAESSDGEDRVTVVTTVPLLQEVVQRVGGGRVEVVNLVPLGVDEHAYQPSTSVPREIARADLVVANGYHLEEGLLSVLVENVQPGVPVVAAAHGLAALEGGDHADEEHADEEHADEEHADEEHADEEPASEGDIDATVFAEGDPHLWLDARNMAAYAENVRDALVRVDPDGADEYRARAEEYVAELEALHEEIVDALSVIPPERRRLIVFHDAFQYFAEAYGFEVTASVAPANPNQATSAAAIADIIDTVRDAGVPTVYSEPQYSAQSLDLIAREADIAVGVLHSVPSEAAPTYAELMRANVSALVEGLGPQG